MLKDIQLVKAFREKFAVEYHDEMGVFLNQQLQKAREEERNFAGEFMTPEDGAWYIKALSELDKDINSKE